MATPGASSSAPLRQHIVVIGADTTCVRLVEELTRAGELLVVLAPGERGREVAEDLTAFGARVITTSRLKVADFHRAQVSLAKAVVILGDDDVFAVRVALWPSRRSCRACGS
jgi:voltage-gated potassium channel Kch